MILSLNSAVPSVSNRYLFAKGGMNFCRYYFFFCFLNFVSLKSVDWFLYDNDFRHERVKKLGLERLFDEDLTY